ncbi:MAG: acyloxyacyl hydrolase [Candidatus Hydrogenedentes bacterium]|nr:acyloxyacyl hydrolase [Candidatus Hydrogenedentota bacterium]
MNFLKCVNATSLAAAFFLAAWCQTAQAGLDFDAGRWRLELNNDFGVHQGSRDRSGDYSLNVVAEYEVPATSRTTLGLRLLPLFVYTQDEHRDRDLFQRWFGDNDHEDGDTVWGGGIGLSGRIYQVKDEYRGWFAEAGITALVHAGKFNGNNSNLNFLSNIGVGYAFKSDWHVQVHYQHISNASLGSHNSGANALGIGVGFKF